MNNDDMNYHEFHWIERLYKIQQRERERDTTNAKRRVRDMKETRRTILAKIRESLEVSIKPAVFSFLVRWDTAKNVRWAAIHVYFFLCQSGLIPHGDCLTSEHVIIRISFTPIRYTNKSISLWLLGLPLRVPTVWISLQECQRTKSIRLIRKI